MHDRADQRDLVCGALDLFETQTEPGVIVDLGRSWSDDESWKLHPLSAGSTPDDSRGVRSAEPVYQTEDDRLLATERHRPPPACTSCIGIDDTP